MAKSLQEILGGRNMTGVIKTVQSGLPFFLPPEFLRPTRQVAGKTATYFKVTGERSNAVVTNYGSPARIVNKQGAVEVGVTLAHTFEQQNHDPLVLQNLMGMNGEPAQNLAISEIDRQSAEFKRRFMNLRQTAIQSIFANGKIFLNGTGGLLYSSSGAVNTIDYGVPDNNLNQANGAIAVPWSTSTADIIGNLTALKRTQVQSGKMPLAHAFYGKNICDYLMRNVGSANASNGGILNLIAQTPGLAEKLYNTGEIPDGLCGLKWHPVHSAYGLDTSGTATALFNDDALVLTPEPSPDWWQLIEGSMLVPNNIGNVYGDPVAAAQDLSQVFGQFGYGVVSHNPVTVSQFGGDTFLPILADPAAIFILDVIA